VVVGRTATIEVTPQQAEILLRGKLMGQLALALRSVTDFEAKQDAVDDEAKQDDQQDVRRSIDMVRYGINTTATVK
jgi:pilus assembly protein CpaB